MKIMSNIIKTVTSKATSDTGLAIGGAILVAAGETAQQVVKNREIRRMVDQKVASAVAEALANTVKVVTGT